MQLKLLVALGADLPGLRVPAGRPATVVDAEALPERDASPTARRAARSATVPAGPARTRGSARLSLPAPSILRPGLSTVVSASALTAVDRLAIPAFDAGLDVGLPAVLDVIV